MGKKTSIYINNADMPVFEAARKLARNGNISLIVGDALREYVSLHQYDKEHDIEVGVWYAHNEPPNVIKISFNGRLLAEGRELTGQLEGKEDRHTKWRIYKTHRGKFLIWWELWSNWAQEDIVADYIVINQFPETGAVYVGTATEIESTPLPEEVVAAARATLNKRITKKLDV